MDTTKQYILMCEKAGEIQKVKPPLRTTTLNNIQRNDIFSSMLMNHFGEGICCDGYSGNWWWIKAEGISIWSAKEKDFIWLPRQDQLQGMLDFGGNPKWWPKLNGLSQFADKGWQASNIKPYHHPYRSFEQLWLAFVMKEKYNKIWTGNEWKIK